MNTPTIQSLLAEKAEKEAEYQQLRDEVRQANARCYELAHDLETMQTIAEGPEAVDREMRRLKAMIRTVESTRDSYATRVVELKRSEAWWIRRVRDAA